MKGEVAHRFGDDRGHIPLALGRGFHHLRAGEGAGFRPWIRVAGSVMVTERYAPYRDTVARRYGGGLSRRRCQIRRHGRRPEV